MTTSSLDTSDEVAKSNKRKLPAGPENMNRALEKSVSSTDAKQSVDNPPSNPGSPVAEPEHKEINLTVSENFAYDDANLILRSNDDVDFKVHRNILSLASAPMKDLIENPPALSKRRRTDAAQSPLPIVSVDETEEDLDYLLRYVYPLSRLSNDSVEDLELGLRLVVRWGLEAAREELGSQLNNTSRIEEDPAKVYALAKEFGLEDTRNSALKRLYEISFEGDQDYFMDETLGLTSRDLQEVISWKRKYLTAVVSIFEKYKPPVIGFSATGNKPPCKGCSAARQWCWWSHFKSKVRRFLDLINEDDLEELVLKSMEIKECRVSHSEIFNILHMLRTEFREKVTAVPVT
ncbi:hypothetical protein SISNIDRAFT_457480 [Sistotremastrum niveocremeum HHB9708]|uniref:BTB domain-containing protein n=1 Tax=Sistotremastrum niveocremeum HHB9708 TaxID=1314777 RepID=A0A164RJY8_9AGAM|nr:hypothetical protein SISNIDRAFT_457480 [Sistotremastrum niveocremeum HHB9708]